VVEVQEMILDDSDKNHGAAAGGAGDHDGDISFPQVVLFPGWRT
jgi:hypothetical protein